MFEFTHSYYRFPDEITNRLDALYNDKIFEVIYEKIKSAKFLFYPLADVVNFKKDSRDPTEKPDDEFFYVEIGSIDTISGKIKAIKMLGKEATSSRVRRVMYKNHVLVSTTRPTRKAIALVPPKLDKEICSTGFAVLEPKPNILPEFLFFALRTDISKHQFERFCSGSGYPAINQEKDLPQILVPVPERIKEQEEILKIVKRIQFKALRFEVQAKKFLHEAKLFFEHELGIEYDKKEEMNYYHKSGSEKRSLHFYCMPEDLDNRLTYLFYNPKLEILEKLKEKYSTTKLSNIVKEPIKRGIQPIYSENGNFPVIKTVDIQEEGINLDQCLKVDDEFFYNNPDYHVKKGDILVASTGIGSLGKVAVYDHDIPAICDGHVSIIRVANGYDISFIAHFLRSHFGQVQIEKYFTGSSGQIELQPIDLGNIIIPDNTITGIPYERQLNISNLMNNKLEKSYYYKKQAILKWIEADKKFEELILM